MTHHSDAEVGDNLLDALAYLRATLTGDQDGREVVARHCDPPGIFEAMTTLVIGHLVQVTTDPLWFVDEQTAVVRANTEARR